MEKRTKIICFVLGIAVLVLIATSVFDQTGKVTLMPEPTYGPIEEDYLNYVDCSYVDEDDGWDVTVISRVKYWDRLQGMEVVTADHCNGYESVREYHCVDGYRRVRNVGCPTNYYCNGGYCARKP